MTRTSSKESWHYHLVRWYSDGCFDAKGDVTVSLISYILRIILIISTSFLVLVWYPFFTYFDDLPHTERINSCKTAGLYYITVGTVVSLIGSLVYLVFMSSTAGQLTTQIGWLELSVIVFLMLPIGIYGLMVLLTLIAMIVDAASNLKVTFKGGVSEPVQPSTPRCCYCKEELVRIHIVSGSRFGHCPTHGEVMVR